MTIKELQQKVDDWIKGIGVRYFSPLTNTVLLSEEVGELSSLMAREYGDQSYKDINSGKFAKEKIEDEMSDILFVLTCLANQMDIDLEEAFERNLNKKTKRDINRHKNNPKLL